MRLIGLILLASLPTRPPTALAESNLLKNPSFEGGVYHASMSVKHNDRLVDDAELVVLAPAPTEAGVGPDASAPTPGGGLRRLSP